MAIVVFGVGQLVLPPLAEHVARDRLAKHGRVQSVSISAFPAIKLLFGDADTVKVRMVDYSAARSQVATSISQADGVANLSASIGTVTSGALTATGVTVTKRGDQLTASGHISEANLRSVVPLLSSVTPVGSQKGTVTLQGSTDNLPVVGTITAEVTVGAQHGDVVLSGTGLLTSLLHLTVWSDPHVKVEALAGRADRGGMSLSAHARLQ